MPPAKESFPASLGKLAEMQRLHKVAEKLRLMVYPLKVVFPIAR